MDGMDSRGCRQEEKDMEMYRAAAACKEGLSDLSTVVVMGTCSS